MLKTVGNAIQQSAPTIKVGSTQIKPIINASNASTPQPVVISQPPVIKQETTETSKSMVKDASAPHPPSSSSTGSSNSVAPVSVRTLDQY